ncbi:MAG TPA: CBS domain-containing protein [Candidatus Altiarchaeales archaeon]|nr:CBS domain-containing protein [Candidatus Altiarchaeales archaeon]
MKVKTDFLIKKLREIEKRRELGEPRVKDLMTKDVLTVDPEDTVVNAAERMLENRVHALLVTEEDKPIGIISSYDLLLVMSISDYDKNTKVRDVMVKDLVTVEPENDIGSALEKMIEYNIRRLVVVKDGRLVGILSLIDLVLGFVDLSKISLRLRQ